ncbi:MAG: PAS domain-containing protein, partial [Ignavibacteriales bacterium]|nr:PAS domain-containing protein [Ignavibacteriales bacterium]
SQRKRITYEGLRVKTNGEFAEVNVVLEPLLHEHPLLQGLVLVSFYEQQPAATKDKRSRVRGKQTLRYVEELERDLASSRDNLQTMVEELETSNEELRSVNEEYQSTNEELQSANEELETSREEMQSLNEELATVNEELQEKVEGLMTLHEDMKVFLDSLDMPTIFLDKDLRIRRFTSQAKRVINIMDQDVGRPLHHLAMELKHTKLLDDCALVNETRKPLQKEVQSQDDRWHLMRILPYKKKDNGMDGIVINFIDFSDLTEIDNDSYNFASGYLVTDVNGDMFVDFSDLTLVDNNSYNFIGANTPRMSKRTVKPVVKEIKALQLDK